MSRPNHRDAIDRTGLLAALAAYDPRIAGTPPLGLDLPASDIDILCHAPDPVRFTSDVWMAFGSCQDFRVWQWSTADRPVVATFVAYDWRFEVFGQAKPVSEQTGWRHFVVERRLLALGGRRLAACVMAFRRNGLKTEPAFAAALKLQGNPYQTLLGLDDHGDEALAQLIDRSIDGPHAT
ncbi:DUF4269 domain-containing protein [Fulvimarina sp. 2208YS6-2-32]|uniref:DUF4269 domain-containing protein n=1 Tax=Fulvimarina uroteuthidis TaxID=3098149 RepID=A0ABU5I1U1_9HYPH|nr:DUF4269 domain-containing protein [Fulvimarina sp. 2208YS6-2-32]MDY8108948.1 DUF4269 domain-containing protein [Fulvimarina sp. 2208YS6-2-32]